MDQEWREDLHAIILKSHSGRSLMTLALMRKQINVMPRLSEIASLVLKPSEALFKNKKENQKAAIHPYLAYVLKKVLLTGIFIRFFQL